LSGFRTHDPRVRGSENSSYFRPRDHCDRLISNFLSKLVQSLFVEKLVQLTRDLVSRLPNFAVPRIRIICSISRDTNSYSTAGPRLEFHLFDDRASSDLTPTVPLSLLPPRTALRAHPLCVLNFLRQKHAALHFVYLYY
jgi:hypothetical protein